MATTDPAAQLDSTIAAIKALADPRRATVEWKLVYNLLKKTAAAGNHLDNVVARRDLVELDSIIAKLRGIGSGEAKSSGPVIDDDTLAAALKGFRRRLKLVKLDHESAIDLRDPTSKGGPSQITAIEPPREWGPQVWAALVERGQLRRVGAGVYEIVAGA